MPAQQPSGPFCQSCGMPMQKPEDFGTDEHGGQNGDFCRYCYQHGAFTDPEITMPVMLDKCVTVMAGQGIMPAPAARQLMTTVLPRLKRWRARNG